MNSTHSDTRGDRVNGAVVRADCHHETTRLARNRHKLDDTCGNLWHMLAEELRNLVI